MFEEVANKDGGLILSNSAAVDQVKAMLKDQMTGKSGLNREQVLVEIDELVDSLIPREVGLASQKGQLLKSKILASAFHQLGIEFNDNSGMLKKQKALQDQLCGDLEVFKMFHDKKEYFARNSMYRVMTQAFHRDANIPLKEAQAVKQAHMNELRKEQMRETYLSDEEHLQRDRRFNMDGLPDEEFEGYQSPDISDGSVENRDLLNELEEVQAKFEDVKKRRAAIKRKIKASENQDKKKSKKLTLGSVMSMEDLETLKQDLDEVEGEYNFLRNTQKQLKKNMKLAEENDDKGSIDKQYEEYYSQLVKEALAKHHEHIERM